MNFVETGIIQKQKIRIRNLLPDIGIEQTRKEIISGLHAKTPSISSKYFYDAKGSELFEKITKLYEYYPTNTEIGILEKLAPILMNRHSELEIIELGSGDCTKISILMNAANSEQLKTLNYIPVDFSQSSIEKSASKLSELFPEININGYVADFVYQVNLIPHGNKPRIICLLGSTIGNFTLTERKQIIKNLSNSILHGDSLLVGFDLTKDESVLHAAYNDSECVTESFNKNILRVVNTLIDSDFNPNDFEHLAFFNKEKMRIEMHLKTKKNLTIHSPYFEENIHFQKGINIHTENSYKFNSDKINEIIEGSDLQIKNTFTDSRNWFALIEFVKK